MQNRTQYLTWSLPPPPPTMHKQEPTHPHYRSSFLFTLCMFGLCFVHSLYVCVLFVRVCVCVHMQPGTHMCACVHACVCVYVHASCMQAHCVCICLCIVCMCEFMRECMHVCMRVSVFDVCLCAFLCDGGREKNTLTNGIMKRLSCNLVPYHCCLSLVGNTDAWKEN